MTIRHIPDEWRAELAARAARQRQSLQEFMLGLIETTVAHPPLELVVERARERVRASNSRVTVEDILESRDADRR
jgi:plasmid stability protein